MYGCWRRPSSLPRYCTPRSDDSGRPMSRHSRVRAASVPAAAPARRSCWPRGRRDCRRGRGSSGSGRTRAGSRTPCGPGRRPGRSGKSAPRPCGSTRGLLSVTISGCFPVRAASGGSRRRTCATAAGRRAGCTCGRAGRALRALRVPGVAPAVAVRVAEVVRLPRVRRHHDGDAAPLSECRRPDHEGRVPDPAVVRGQLDEVDAGRPRAERAVDVSAAVAGFPRGLSPAGRQGGRA